MAVAVNKRSIMTLFSSPTDIFSHQVRIVLAEKGVNVDIEMVNSNNLPQDLIDLNPYRTVPTLVDRELVLYNAKIIMEYLDERFPHPSLMPVYPVARGNSRLMAYRIEQDWYSLLNKIITSPKTEADAARQQLRDELLSVAPVFAEFPYFMSEEFSLVDCYLTPLLWRLPYYQVALSGTGSKALNSYMQRLFDRDAFLASLTDTERAMSNYFR
ncbi:MAG: stringent starvation protein SspA [Candidatus Symbiodolus clandestinus]